MGLRLTAGMIYTCWVVALVSIICVILHLYFNRYYRGTEADRLIDGYRLPLFRKVSDLSEPGTWRRMTIDSLLGTPLSERFPDIRSKS